MKIFSIALITLLVVITSSCGRVDLSEGTIDGIRYKETDTVTNYVKIEMNTNDIMLIELYPEVAPISVKNFQDLVKDKFYDGVNFHRVIAGFVIQAGIPKDETKTFDNIIGEFRRNGIDNDLSHKRGVISMARMGTATSGFDTASTQFFICHRDRPDLDELYAAFGMMLAGFETLDKIANVRTNERDEPISTQTIRNIRFIEIERKN
jgi:peptidyl-prolyl cis-trans isomerase B (cyclophilin B)